LLFVLDSLCVCVCVWVKIYVNIQCYIVCVKKAYSILKKKYLSVNNTLNSTIALFIRFHSISRCLLYYVFGIHLLTLVTVIAHKYVVILQCCRAVLYKWHDLRVFCWLVTLCSKDLPINTRCQYFPILGAFLTCRFSAPYHEHDRSVCYA